MSKNLTKVSEIIEEISMGPFGSDIKVDNFVRTGVPVLNGANLPKFKLLEEEFRYVTPDKARTFRKAIAKRGDIVITHRGTLGQISYIPDNSKFKEYVISQSQFRVALNRQLVDPAFFVYYFHTTEGQKRLLANKCHVGVPALAQATTNFRLIEIPLPSLPTQKKIAALLSALDSKIELNNRINAELEAMAKTLYDYWFVQFDFPDKNGKPYKTSGGKMVWNEELKREIPDGWEVKNLTKEMDLQYGFPFSTELFNDDGIGVPVIRIRDILNCSISNYSTEEVDDKYRINKGDIIVGMDGNFHINYWNRDNCYLNQRSLRIRSNNESISEIQARYSIEPFIQAREKNVSRTTVAHLSAKDINDLKILKADNEFQNKANTYFNSNLEKIVSNRIQNHKLTELRDWLLPMLMNGQVKVS